MTHPPMVSPMLDPTPIFEVFRGNHGTELLTAAVAHFRVFERLAHGPMTFDELRREPRPGRAAGGRPDHGAPGVRAPGRRRGGADRPDRAGPRPPDARRLLRRQRLHRPGAPSRPGVVEMVERLRTNRPAGSAADEDGAAFIFKEGIESAMESRGVGPVADAGPGRPGPERGPGAGREVPARRRPAAPRRRRRDRDLQHRLAPPPSRPPRDRLGPARGPQGRRRDGRDLRRRRPPRSPARRHVQGPRARGGRRDPALERPARLGRRRLLDAGLADAPRPSGPAAGS